MANRLTSKPKVIFCDVDKTLTSRNTWLFLTQHLNADVEEHFRLYQQYLHGEIDFQEEKQKLFALWEAGYGGKIPKRVVKDILFRVDLKGEAFSTFSELRDKGYQLCLISSSMDEFVRIAAQKLSLDHWLANSQLIYDEAGYWIDFEYDRDEAGLKVRQVEEFLKQHNLDESECLILGDDKTEIPLFEKYTGISVDTELDELKQVAWKDIKYIPTLLQILESI